MVIEINRSGFHRISHQRFSKIGSNKNKKQKQEQEQKKKKNSSENFSFSLYRTKKILRKIILNQNFEKTSFLTLTFRENVTDLDVAKYEFQKFIKRLNYFLYSTKKSQIKYIAVPERQTRGAWHFHILLFDVPFILNDDVSKIWKNGFIKINQIKVNNMMDVFRYISKYISKQFDEGQKHLKRFLSSQGFFKGYELKIFNVDDQEYDFECKYWIQNLYSKDDYRFVSGYMYEYEINQHKFFTMIEFYFSKNFFDEIERMHRERIKNEFEAFRNDT
jgi:hypothetical protein